MCIAVDSAPNSTDLIVDFAHRRSSFIETASNKQVNMGILVDSSSNSNDLIVDFAHRRSSFIETKDTVSVRFSPLAEVKFFQRSDHSYPSELYYTNDDYQAFQQDHVRDADESPSKSQEILEGSDWLLTGIEKFLTPTSVQETIQRRQTHRQAVFDEQQRQRDIGENNPEIVACVSLCQSMYNVKRAKKVGFIRRVESW